MLSGLQVFSIFCDKHVNAYANMLGLCFGRLSAPFFFCVRGKNHKQGEHDANSLLPAYERFTTPCLCCSAKDLWYTCNTHTHTHANSTQQNTVCVEVKRHLNYQSNSVARVKFERRVTWTPHYSLYNIRVGCSDRKGDKKKMIWHKNMEFPSMQLTVGGQISVLTLILIHWRFMISGSISFAVHQFGLYRMWENVFFNPYNATRH